MSTQQTGGTSTRNDRWIRRPRRSTGDRKIAGVAGGLGRAFGIDPILIRVAFVVLTIFGGVGGLLYVLGWLLLAADGDEVSAAEALLGRGRSSVPPPLAVGLGVVAVIAAFSMFSWGLPFLPLAVGGVIVLAVLRKRGRLHTRPDWTARQNDWMNRVDHQVQTWSMGHTRPTGASSPFERPAFWEQPQRAEPVDLHKSAPADEFDAPTPRSTPPAWDPLGVAPFAWDLPEPTPVSTVNPTASRRGGAVAQVTLGLTLLAGGLTAAGVFAGWWVLSWAQVSGIALGVLGLGLLVSALRGRGHSLIGPGVFLSLVTAALAVTGVSGTTGYGQQHFAPATYAQVQDSYTAQAGDLRVDLSAINIPPGVTRDLTVQIKGGHAEVVVPASMKVNVTCEADVGQVMCLNAETSGPHSTVTTGQAGTGETGTLNLTVKARAGAAEVIVQ